MATSSSPTIESICRNEFDQGNLIDPPRILERGFLGWGGDLIVQEGTVVVLTEDGRHVRTLPPGKYPLKSFRYGSQLRAYTVYTALNNFFYRADNYFRIYERAGDSKGGFPVNVSLSVEFRVSQDKAHVLIANAENMVSMKPVTILCTRMTSIIWKQLSQIGYDAFYANGSFLAQEILDQLRKDDIEGDTGLTIRNVLPIAFDGADEIGAKIREGVVQGYDVLNKYGFTPREVWQIRSESRVLAAQGAADHELRMLALKHVLEKGSLPFADMDRPVGGGSSINDVVSILLGYPPRMDRIPEQPDVEVKQTSQPTPVNPVPITPEVIDAEWEALERLVGVANLDGHPTTSGRRNSPDGGYEFIAKFTGANGNLIEVTLHLPPGYGNGAVPSRTVKRNGVVEDYPGVEPSEWRRNPKLTSLVEVVQRTYS